MMFFPLTIGVTALIGGGSKGDAQPEIKVSANEKPTTTFIGQEDTRFSRVPNFRVVVVIEWGHCGRSWDYEAIQSNALLAPF